MSIWFVRLTSIVMGLTLCGLVVLYYLAFVQTISPLQRQTFVSIEATNAGGHGTFIITREFCVAEQSEGSIIRIFRHVPDNPGDLEEVFELAPLPIHLLAGCHKRPRIVDLPDSITPGHYLYQMGLRFCSPIRCATDWMPIVKVEVDSFEGRHQLKIADAR